MTPSPQRPARPSPHPYAPGANSGLVPVGYAPGAPIAYPAAAPVPPVPPRGRGAGFWVMVTVGIAAGVLGALLAGFFIGQGSRLSDQQVKAKVTAQRHSDDLAKSSALADQRRTLARGFSSRLQKIIDRVANRAEARGVSQGRADGFSQGHSQGFSEGQAAGYNNGFDRGTCYTPITLEYVC